MGEVGDPVTAPFWVHKLVAHDWVRMEDARQERSKLKASPLEPPCTRAIHFVISRSSPFFMGWEALSRKGVRLVFSSVVEPSTL